MTTRQFPINAERPEMTNVLGHRVLGIGAFLVEWSLGFGDWSLNRRERGTRLLSVATH